VRTFFDNGVMATGKLYEFLGMPKMMNEDASIKKLILKLKMQLGIVNV